MKNFKCILAFVFELCDSSILVLSLNSRFSSGYGVNLGIACKQFSG